MEITTYSLNVSLHSRVIIRNDWDILVSGLCHGELGCFKSHSIPLLVRRISGSGVLPAQARRGAAKPTASSGQTGKT